MLDLAVPLLCFLIALITTRIMVSRAVVYDIPDQRSSHIEAKPSGGGFALVVAFLAYLVWSLIVYEHNTRFIAVLLISSLVIGITGYIDDVKPLAASKRLCLHFVCALAVLWSIGRLPQIQIFGAIFEPGIVLGIIYLFSYVWWINLFNFMDGIDGIAGVEVVSVLVCVGVMLLAQGEMGWFGLHMALLASVMGFLVYNWPPAKIFMGDIGSGFLGLILGALAFATVSEGVINLWSWVILLAVFVADASITLIRRVLAGQRIVEAHRSHAYQILARRWQSHKKVTLSVLVFNVAWLFPLAWGAAAWPYWGVVFVLAAYMPLTLLALVVGAGTTND